MKFLFYFRKSSRTIENKSKTTIDIDIYDFDIRPLEHSTFPLISVYLDELINGNVNRRLTVLRTISIVLGDLHRFLTSNTSSISSIGAVKKRFQTHTVPSTLQTQQIHIDPNATIDEENEEIVEDKLDLINFEIFQMFFVQTVRTMKTIHQFLTSNENRSNGDESMETEDELRQLMDHDRIKTLANRIFFYGLDSFYYLISLFKSKMSSWQKEIEQDTNCFNRLLQIFNKTLFENRTNKENHLGIFQELTKFTEILDLIDATRLCQSLELFIHLFEEETQQVREKTKISLFFPRKTRHSSCLSFQDELYRILTKKCRKLLEESSLDTNNNAIRTHLKMNNARAVEVLLNIYLLHVESNEINSVIDGLVHYSLKVFRRNEEHSDDEESSDTSIVDLSTWNMKATFLIYFRSLFKHFIIKARSIRLPSESKKKTELENLAGQWMELNEIFRQFVSFVTIDQIYKKNPSVCFSHRKKNLTVEKKVFVSRRFRRFFVAQNSTSMCFELERCLCSMFTFYTILMASNNC